MTPASGILDLYVGGVDTSSGTLDLHTKGPIVSTGNINLHLAGGSFVTIENDLNFFVDASASGASYIFKQIDLFVPSEAMDININLFVQGSTQSASVSGSMNLFVGGKGGKAAADVDLVVAAATGSGIYKFDTLDLFIQGQGTLAGSVPISANMNLFLATVSGLGAQLDLVIPSVVASGDDNFPMHIFGVSGLINDSFNLFVNGLLSFNAQIDLFTRGFNQ